MKFNCLFSINFTLCDSDGVDALLRKFVEVFFAVIIFIFAQHLLNNPQVTFIVNFDTRLRSPKRLDNLDSDPVFLVFKFSDNSFFESLETLPLLEDSQLAIFPDFELVTKRVGKFQLRLLFFV